MKISPVTFGRAIRVNSSLEVAKQIATAANAANYGDISSLPQTKELRKFISSIFNDTQLPNGRAKVVELAPEEIYIFSGREAAIETKVSQEAKAKIKENEDFVKMLPERITRRQQQIKYDNINEGIKKTTIAKIRGLLEDGINNQTTSTLDIKTKEKKILFGVNIFK